MHERSRPPTFDQREWAAFDFSRWHLDGLPVDATSAALANLAQRLFSSEEWRQHFQGSLAMVQRGVLDSYREYSRQLADEKTDVARDFDERIAAAETRSEEFRRMIETAASPPIVQAEPHIFQLGVRVTAGDPHVGLPGIIVQITAPRDPKTVLAHGVTDRDGNALLTIPVAEAGELDKGEATLEALTVGGKSLQKLPGAVYIRPSQAETKVVSLKDSPDIAPNKTAALSIRSEREARASTLFAGIDRLRQEREARLRDLDSRLEDAQDMIARLEQATAPAPPPAASPAEPAASTPGESSKKDRPSAPKKRRRRS